VTQWSTFRSRRCNWLSAFAFAFIASSFAVSAQDQPFGCNAPSNPPGDISLHLSLKNGQTVFREGEIIALTAEYKADTKKKYILNNRGYDRSGRLDGVEVFCIDPDRGVDPLRDYFNGVFAFMGGGLSSEQDPGEKPYVVELELNEWQSLPPGSYRLSIVGNRIALQAKHAQPNPNDRSVPLQSNPVEFQVVQSDPGWQSVQLALAATSLDSPNATEEERNHAARVLRFLGSEAATQELAHRFWSGAQTYGWDMKFGLFGSKYRVVAIQEMKGAITNPQHPVTREFVNTLATLELQSDPKYRLPPYDPKTKDVWNKAREAYSAELDRRIAEYMSEAAASTQAKSGEAQALTASELLQSGVLLNPEDKIRWRQMLLASWDSLPVNTQNELIGYRWSDVGGPEWLPVLERIVEDKPNPNRAVGRPARDEALRRIGEIDPDLGGRLTLEEIANPNGDIGIDVLGLLPERELPQIEAPTIERIKSGGHDIDFSLMDRFASAGALDQMKLIYDAHRGKWACTPQTAMLRYFLRISPDYGAKETSLALAERKTTGCFRTQLSNLMGYLRLPQMEQLAIDRLDDPSPSVARDAAEALQNYGSPKAEAALWARLEAFHRKWKDKPDDQLHPNPGEIVYDQDSGLEEALVQAIANGQAWVANGDTIHRLKGLSSPVMQPTLDNIAESLMHGEFAGALTWYPDGELHFAVGWYNGTGMAALKEKLAQFRAGSHFGLSMSKGDQEAHRRELAELVDAAATEGLLLNIH
jgi:hypothetical protein